MKKLLTYILGALAFAGCDSYLDELPDNRTTLDNETKIKKILVAAYPNTYPNVVTELASDNIDDLGESNPYSDRVLEQAAYWRTIENIGINNLNNVWESVYNAISNANEALKAIEELGNPTSLDAARGEALVARAYGHFILVNLFGNHYNSQTSNTDLGVTYMLEAETTLSPKYERNTVKEVYDYINNDLETGLPLINDGNYQILKYHFNQSAAYAFAAKFNLFYENWDKAIEYATRSLGTTPRSTLRDWAITVPGEVNNASVTFSSTLQKANLLVHSTYSGGGLIFGPYYSGARFNHIAQVANRETTGSVSISGTPKVREFAYVANNLDKVLVGKLPYIFEYTDVAAGIGYNHSVVVPFTSDETLLIRAEAYALKKQYGNALTDLNMWSENFFINAPVLDENVINTFYDGLNFSTDDVPSQKKKLSPKFTLETGTQENFIHCILQYRRLATLLEGHRWYDIRRYGIEVIRYSHEGLGRQVADRLTPTDLRRTFQIPDEVIRAGLTPNPRP